MFILRTQRKIFYFLGLSGLFSLVTFGISMFHLLFELIFSENIFTEQIWFNALGGGLISVLVFITLLPFDLYRYNRDKRICNIAGVTWAEFVAMESNDKEEFYNRYYKNNVG